MTFIVKTFERPRALRRLLASARKRYPDATILVADDSRHPVENVNATVFPLPFDSGVSRGRNFLLDHVDTPFFLQLDDDYVFDDASKIEHLLTVLLESEVDIAAGESLHAGRPSRFHGLLEREDGTLLAIPAGRGEVAGCTLYDFVPNLFVGRTEVVRQLRWDDELKLGEHLEFFWRARMHGITVALHPRVTMRHVPEGSPLYVGYRRRGEREYRALMLRKCGFRRIENRVVGRAWSLLSDGVLFVEPAMLAKQFSPPPPRRVRLQKTIEDALVELRRARTIGLGASLGVNARSLVTASLRALPSFLLLGPPEAGVEDLWRCLIDSGSVALPSPGGARFFDHDHWRGLRWYRAHYPLARDLGERLAGDASTTCLAHPRASSRAHALLPRAKLVVLLCDPIERCWRHFLRQRQLGNEPLASLRDALLAEADRIHPAWHRARWERVPADDALTMFSYVTSGHYADLLRGWLDHFGRDQILVLQRERLAAAPREELLRIEEFLGIPVVPGALHWTLASEEGLDTELRQTLREHFAMHDTLLADLLGEPLAWQPR